MTRRPNAYLDLVAGRVDLVLADRVLLIWEWLKGCACGDFEFKGRPYSATIKIRYRCAQERPCAKRLNGH